LARLTVVINTEELFFPVCVTKITKMFREISILSKTVTVERTQILQGTVLPYREIYKREKRQLNLSNFTVFENSASVLDRLRQKKTI
jgi:hypothetical protein